MERCSMLLYGLLIASGILSSQARDIFFIADDKEYTNGEVKGLVVELSPDSTEVLSGNVTLSFHFPGNCSLFKTAERTLSVFVYDNSTGQKLHTENVRFRSDLNMTIVLPCEVFDHPGLYRFKYRISDSDYEAFISKTLTLKWGDIRFDSPKTHTALTRLSSIWIQHNRKCMPKKNRDSINLLYLKGNKFVAKKYVRKLSNGRQGESHGSWIRMGFSCHVFDTEGSYALEYMTGFANTSLAKSDPFDVHWDRPILSPPANKIFPCKTSFIVSFKQLDCPYARLSDVIQLRDKYSETIIARRRVTQGHTAVFFQCSLFKEYVEEYCFDYVTYSRLTGHNGRIASKCLPTHAPGTSNYSGWSSWSSWGLCSSSCGEGKQRRYRYCLSVRTSNKKESTCAGNSLMSRSCALNPCPVSGWKCTCECQLTEPEGMITSSPQLFTRVGSFTCTWVISLPAGNTVRLSFDALELNGDFIIIRDGVDTSAPAIAIIKDGNHKLTDPIFSTGNSLYIFYKHNGDWTNGTRRGFTASYRTVEKTAETGRGRQGRKSLGKQEVIFLSVFIFAMIVFGLLLFIVFNKIRQRHKSLHTSASSGSSSTSECTLRSSGTPSPLDDEASCNEPLKGSQHVKNGPRRSSHRKKIRRTEFLCDADRVPRCTCGDFSELESASGSNSAASGYSPVRKLRGEDGVGESVDIPCDCPDCIRYDRYLVGVSQEFRAPDKKYYGDWMNNCYHTDQRIYGDPCKSFV
ncbi:uncharacterized protein [Montipora foliosa]|uniref:uncharacterized protein isoform X3 n=1 Tax=Montipora foliosa TaxID=591990 RepID=UPI0035F16DCB